MPTPAVLADRFELGEALGRGGMAEVYRAHDRVLHRDVAVKLLRDASADESDRRRFEAEARTLARLSHRGLVMVLDVGSAEDHPFLVLELVEGTTLARRIADGPLPPEEVGRIGRQLAEALAYAHEAGVVHRDVKPANVLLDPRGRAKLADFGIARLIGDTVRHTRTGTTVGTAAYLAPEQVQGEDVSGATDVYALALVLVEALSGKPAFGGAPVEAAMARLHRDPELPGGVPHHDLLRAMTARDPVARPSAREVVAALAEPVAAGSPTATAVLTVPPATADGGSPTGTRATTPFTDRAGDALARRSGDLVARARSLPPHTMGFVGALVAMLVLVVIVALASGGERTAEPSLVPDDTPRELRAPLQDLHDAVNGR